MGQACDRSAEKSNVCSNNARDAGSYGGFPARHAGAGHDMLPP
jgi:hypothetical protein